MAYANPTIPKISPVIAEWWCHEKSRDQAEIWERFEITKIVEAIWTTEKFATNFFESFVAAIEKVPKTTEIMAKNTTSSTELKKVLTKKFKAPIVANFSAYPANATEPGHDASTCASGNQNEPGNSGIFKIIAIDTVSAAAHEI